jgi:anaerobic magnesium-protoporphyrin IX monomethyl ester cyclase
MSDVLFINFVEPSDYLNLIEPYSPQTVLATEMLGVSYVASALKKAGFSCDFVDSQIEGLNFEAFLNRIIARAPSLLIGVSSEAKNFKRIMRAVDFLRDNGIATHITMGGMWASLKHALILEHYPQIDSVVVGEGEETAVSLTAALRDKRNWQSIPGVASRDRDSKVALIPRRFIANIDSFSPPDRTYYQSHVTKNALHSVIFSRGCAGRCTFCAVSSYLESHKGKRRRVRDPVQFVDEIEQIVKQTQANKFYFNDVDFIGLSRTDRNKCRIVANEICKRGLDINFSILAQARGIDSLLLKALQEAGLRSVHIGIESWSDTQLKRYGKRSTQEENKHAVETLDKLGISYITYLIPLDPYTSRKELLNTLHCVGETGIEKIFNIDFCKSLLLWEESALYQQCLRDRLVKSYDPFEASISGIPYRQYQNNMIEIVEAADEMKTIYESIKIGLRKTGREKALPEIWNLFSDDVIETLRKKMFAFFNNLVETGPAHGEGRRAVLSTFGSLRQRIAGLCSSTSSSELKTHPSLSIVIDGQEVSTQSKETYVFRLR